SKPFPHPEPGGQAGPWLPPSREVLMAYRELGVIEIREVLRRFCLGDSVRAVARGIGSDRNTVANYLAAARAAGLQPGAGGPTDEQVAAVLAAGRGPGGGRPRVRCRTGWPRIASRSPGGWPTACG